MRRIKKGDIVGRKSYGKDVIFIVKNIIKTKNSEDIAILKGMIERVEADSKISDLEFIDKEEINKAIKKVEDKVKQKEIASNYQIGLITKNNRNREKIVTGKILHLDGDRKYSQKSYAYYKKLGLNAVVKNIPEYRQPKVVYNLLEIYNPDILVITGHDGMIKRGTRYNDIYNYRNSRHFIETVKEARRYDKKNQKNLVIFARSMSKLF